MKQLAGVFLIAAATIVGAWLFVSAYTESEAESRCNAIGGKIVGQGWEATCSKATKGQKA
jgi:hypothetical protein